MNYAVCGKVELFYNVNVDWGLISDDYSYDDVDYSDDDIVDRSQVNTAISSISHFPAIYYFTCICALPANTSLIKCTCILYI